MRKYHRLLFALFASFIFLMIAIASHTGNLAPSSAPPGDTIALTMIIDSGTAFAASDDPPVAVALDSPRGPSIAGTSTVSVSAIAEPSCWAADKEPKTDAASGQYVQCYVSEDKDKVRGYTPTRSWFTAMPRNGPSMTSDELIATPATGATSIGQKNWVMSASGKTEEIYVPARSTIGQVLRV